jgi:D-inositol-3-phosphate glycosyltransferase
MRIAMVSEHASPLAPLGGPDAGGQNVHVAELSTALASAGHQVVVHTRRTDPAQRRRVAWRPGATVQHDLCGPPAPLAKDDIFPHLDQFADQLRRSWRVDPPDVVHTHFWMSAIAALRAAEDLPAAVRPPIAHTFHALGVVKRRHQGVADTSPPRRVALEREIATRVDRVVATCSDEVFELVRQGVPRRRITVVPSGVDTSALRPDIPALAEPPRTARHRLVVLGRLVPRKGTDDAIRAVAALPDTELLVAGGPSPAGLAADPDARRLRELADQLGVGERVHLLGGVDRDTVPTLLTSADAVVCVPWYEPFGIVPLEAMACGVPVVASAVGGLTDTVVNGVTGLHVPARDPRRLAEVLRTLLADPGPRASLGVAGRKRAVARYSWPRIAADTARVYQRLRSGPAAESRATTMAGAR